MTNTIAEIVAYINYISVKIFTFNEQTRSFLPFTTRRLYIGLPVDLKDLDSRRFSFSPHERGRNIVRVPKCVVYA